MIWPNIVSFVFVIFSGGQYRPYILGKGVLRETCAAQILRQDRTFLSEVDGIAHNKTVITVL
jgi:hypothetical protein